MTVWLPYDFSTLTWLFTLCTCPLNFHFTIHFRIRIYKIHKWCGTWWLMIWHNTNDVDCMMTWQRQAIICCFFLCVFLKIEHDIFFHLRHSTWVSNLVPIRKKSEEIRSWVDFWNLNCASDKDNYLMPSMENILQIVSGAQMFSLLDEFPGYNQVLVAEPDRLKTTKWGTFTYRWMSFGLVNAGITFQRTMDITFHGIIRQIVVVYLDDVTVFSRKRENHIFHLKKNFEQCRKYKISLNPQKSIFAVSEGNLLGHIVSKSRIKVDPTWVQTIT